MLEKRAVITGATSGIGYETALELARRGFEIIIIGRDESRGQQSVSKIKDETENEKILFVKCDLSSQKQIRRAAAEIKDKYDRLDVLINNAGVWLSKRTLSEDQIEFQLAVNHVAPFLLTHLLLPSLKKSEDARIINLGSDAHIGGKIHWNDIFLSKGYNGLKAHRQTKLASLLFTYELDRKFRQKKLENLSVHCVQPGLVKTDIGLKDTIWLHSFFWKIRRSGGVSVKEGAQTSVFLSCAENIKNQSGKYWDNCKPKKSSKNSYYQDDAKKLWQQTLEWTGIEDYFNS